MGLKFSACLDFLFLEAPYRERFGLAKQAGFEAVELHYPECDVDEIRDELRRHDLRLALYNFPVSDRATSKEYFGHGERGLWALPEKQTEFWSYVPQAFENAARTGARCVHGPVGNRIVGQETRQREILIDNLARVARLAEKQDVTILLEVYSLLDRPDYLLRSFGETLEIVRTIGSRHMRLLIDIYHLRILGEDPIRILSEHKDWVGHIQFADYPGRHEPGTGDIDYRAIFAFLSASRYEGFVGAEYKPSQRTENTFGWMKWA